MYHEVTQIDYVHSHTAVDVRYRPGTGIAVPQPAEPAAAAPTVVPETIEDTQVLPAVTRPTELVLASSPSSPRVNGAARPE